MRVFYLVSPTVEGGIADATGWGWQQVARTRFVTPAKTDVRLISRWNELLPLAGGPTPLLRGSGYTDGRGLVGPAALERWEADRQRFAEFVESGAGQWIERTGDPLNFPCDRDEDRERSGLADRESGTARATPATR